MPKLIYKWFVSLAGQRSANFRLLLFSECTGCFCLCFSASASFAVAGINALIGVAILCKKPARYEIPLAGFPLLFALQQFVEGLLWILLPDAPQGMPVISALAMLFIVFAEIIWPVMTPIAVLMIETAPQRRRILRGLALLGLLVSGYLLYAILTSPVNAEIHNHSIRYFNDFPYLVSYRLVYVVAISGPLLLSSQHTIRIFGVLVFLGYIMSLYLYIDVLISVWCFFAAAASGVLYFHFQRLRPV